VRRLRRYLQESWSELKKVAWPTRDQVRNLTVLVFIVSAAIGVFIAIWDYIFTLVIQLITPGVA
jgi:preprotein translocase SecE subunit